MFAKNNQKKISSDFSSIFSKLILVEDEQHLKQRKRALHEYLEVGVFIVKNGGFSKMFLLCRRCENKVFFPSQTLRRGWGCVR